MEVTSFVEHFDTRTDIHKAMKNVEREQTKSRTAVIKKIFGRKFVDKASNANGTTLDVSTQSALMGMQKVLVFPLDTCSVQHSAQMHLPGNENISSRPKTPHRNTSGPGHEQPFWRSQRTRASSTPLSTLATRPYPSTMVHRPLSSQMPQSVAVEDVRKQNLTTKQDLTGSSINHNDMTIGDLKERIAMRLSMPCSKSLKLVINGRILNNNDRSAGAIKRQWGNRPFTCFIPSQFLLRLDDKLLQSYGIERVELRITSLPLAVHLNDDGSIVLAKKRNNLENQRLSRRNSNPSLRRSLIAPRVPPSHTSLMLTNATPSQVTAVVPDILHRLGDAGSSRHRTNVITTFRIESGDQAGQVWQSECERELWVSGQIRLEHLKHHVLRQLADVKSLECIELKFIDGPLIDLKPMQSWYSSDDPDSDRRRWPTIKVHLRDSIALHLPARNWTEHIYFDEGIISKGTLTIRDVREEARRVFNVSITQNIRLFHGTQVLELDTAKVHFPSSTGQRRIIVHLSDAPSQLLSVPTPPFLDLHDGNDLVGLDKAPSDIDTLTPIRAGLQGRDCIICGDTCAPYDYPGQISTKCAHEPSCCTDCIQAWIASELESKGWDKIRCPECLILLEHAEIRSLATNATFERSVISFVPFHIANSDIKHRFDALATRSFLSSDPDFHFCLSPTCTSGQIHPSPSSNPIMTCVSCTVSWCLTHKMSWHVGETCAAYDKRLSSEAKAKQRAKEDAESESTIKETAKQCPGKGCGYWIEKNHGCDHMTCRKCRWEFCWLCLCDYNAVRRDGNHRHSRECRWWAPEGNKSVRLIEAAR
ncbi:hypothetical protein EJ05DRAFT_540349 [Pseudovirgaria hyperparasitica]|uniref:RBR-type E3 ubiquitin transferase n=1 Tax=Pseudovirgaria hyperparasitica TaxID=470096 RepID=A0A6A6VZK5_9PEZI|nr:uncharacterized protein EJ05DRAFT_540349 [Pseudovirgaria hyperparasitica]KAF2755675.1 hypothetical protein EJ05DRAFT_540349 [Pseudovirgaria hyperparasitica]